MGTVQPAYRQDLVTLCCGECGIEFAVPSWWDTSRREDHKTWYCPNGHPRHFTGETANEARIRELERAVERERRYRGWAESAKRSADIRRGKAEAARKRLEARVNAGICPHCHRTVGQLARHIKTKHPDCAPIAKGNLP